MRKLTSTLAGLPIAAVGIGAITSPATAAAPMKVKITPFAGKKVRVAKRLKVYVTCTKDCAAKVRITLITPAGNSTVKGGRNLPANQGWITGMILNRYGLSILKKHYRSSRFRVAVTARNLKNGTVRTNTKTFRFRR
jgi:hypothetical protein